MTVAADDARARCGQGRGRGGHGVAMAVSAPVGQTARAASRRRLRASGWPESRFPCGAAGPARYPLDGLQRLAPGRSSIVLHATPQLESLPRLSSQEPRIQMTSGLASLSRRVIGPRLVHELEPLGAVIITVGGSGEVHLRRISADPQEVKARSSTVSPGRATDERDRRQLVLPVRPGHSMSDGI